MVYCSFDFNGIYLFLNCKVCLGSWNIGVYLRIIIRYMNFFLEEYFFIYLYFYFFVLNDGMVLIFFIFVLIK